jgi:hypothetical protein
MDVRALCALTAFIKADNGSQYINCQVAYEPAHRADPITLAPKQRQRPGRGLIEKNSRKTESPKTTLSKDQGSKPLNFSF